MKRVTEQEAIEQARQYIETITPPAWGKVEVYCWTHYKGDPVVGVRVAEVSFFFDKGGGTGYGSSSMQTDPEGAALCFVVERLIMEIMHGRKWVENDEEAENELIDAKWRVRFALGLTEEQEKTG